MDRTATSRVIARAPWGLAGMLALVVAVEAFVGGRDPAFTTHAVDIWTDAREQATGAEVRESAVLCLGDSQIQQGVLASVVGERLGEPVYNLAVPAGQPGAAYALLRRALGAGARPRALVVGFFPTMLAFDMRVASRTLPEILGPAEALDLAFTGRDAGLAASTLLRLALPSYRAREEVRANVAAALRGEVDGLRAEAVERRKARRAARGSLALPSNPYFADGLSPTGPTSRAGLAWGPSPVNGAYLRRLLGLARERGLPVYWVVTPVSPAERALRDRQGLAEGFDRFLRRLQAEFPDLVVLDGQSMGFDKTAFGDQYHIDGRAAAVLSRSVAGAIAAGPSASRWVALTPIGEGSRLARGSGAGVAR